MLSCWLQNYDSPVVLPIAHLLLFILLLFHTPAVWPTFNFSDRTQSFALLRWYLLNYKEKNISLDDLGLLSCDAVSLCELLPKFRRILMHWAPHHRRLNHQQEQYENLKFRSACFFLMHYKLLIICFHLKLHMFSTAVPLITCVKPQDKGNFRTTAILNFIFHY